MEHYKGHRTMHTTNAMMNDPTTYVADETQLCRQMETLVWNLVYEFVKTFHATNDWDADDVYQAGMIGVIEANRNWVKKPQEAPYVSYLLRAARLKIIDYRRSVLWRERRQKDGSQEMLPRDPWVMAEDNTKGWFEDDHTDLNVEAFIATLKPKDQKLVRVLLAGGESRDVANAEGVTGGAISHRKQTISRKYAAWAKRRVS